MKGFNIVTVTAAIMVFLLVLDVTFTQAAPTDGWSDGHDVDDNLVQLVARKLIEEMGDFQRMRRTGMSARHGALSDYMKMRALNARINNPYGPGRRK